MSWTFHSADHPEPTARTRGEKRTSELHNLRHREADLARHLDALRERRAFYPKEVTARQVSELATKLDALRARIDDLLAQADPRD